MNRRARVLVVASMGLTAALVVVTLLLLVGVVSRGGPTLTIVGGACALVATVAGFLATFSVYRKMGQSAQ